MRLSAAPSAHRSLKRCGGDPDVDASRLRHSRSVGCRFARRHGCDVRKRRFVRGSRRRRAMQPGQTVCVTDVPFTAPDRGAQQGQSFLPKFLGCCADRSAVPQPNACSLWRGSPFGRDPLRWPLGLAGFGGATTAPAALTSAADSLDESEGRASGPRSSVPANASPVLTAPPSGGPGSLMIDSMSLRGTA